MNRERSPSGRGLDPHRQRSLNHRGHHESNEGSRSRRDRSPHHRSSASHNQEAGSRSRHHNSHRHHRSNRRSHRDAGDEFPGYRIVEAPDFESSEDEVDPRQTIGDRLRDSEGNMDLGLLEQFEQLENDRESSKVKPKEKSPTVDEKEEDTQDNNDLLTTTKSILNVNYEFGDRGSNWRMMKLDKIIDSSKFSAQSAEDIALERYGNLALYYIALEEKEELNKRKRSRDKSTWIYKPAGRLAKANGIIIDEPPKLTKEEVKGENKSETNAITEQDVSNVKIEMMKAKIRKAGNYEELEMKLKIMESRLKSQSQDNERKEQLVDEDSLTVSQMLKQEKLSTSRSNVRQSAKQIASIQKFDNSDLDYQDEMANNLAKLSKNNKISLNKVVQDPRLVKALETCKFCLDTKSSNLPILSTTENFYLTLLPKPELTKYGCIITTYQHYKNSLMLGNEEFNELNDIMKTLGLFYYREFKQNVLFYEESISPNCHFTIRAIPIPLSFTPSVLKSYFIEGILEQYDDNINQHKSIIETMNSDYRTQIAKEAPFYHVWFNVDGGLGHIVENEGWPKGDMFSRSIIGGFLGLDGFKIRGKTRFIDDKEMVGEFKKKFEKYTGSMDDKEGDVMK